MVCSIIEQAAQAGARDQLTAKWAALLAQCAAEAAAQAQSESRPEPFADAFVATIAAVEMYSPPLGFSPEGAKNLAFQAACVARARAAALWSQKSFGGNVRIGDALLSEEKELLNKPGRSDQERRALLQVIVRECIYLEKPLPALIELHDKATRGTHKLRSQMKVGEIVAHFQRLHGEGMPVKLAEFETAAAFGVSTKTVQRHRKRQREQKSGQT